MKISNTKLGYCLSMTIKGFSIFFLLLFSLGSIAQNKIAGVITDGDGKINAVEVQ
jgi:Fe(3+) dicitrate transport protein